MKTRFNTYDIICSITELQRLIGMRVNQVYDIDHKTYLIKLQRSEEKCVLLLESGSRFHTTAFEWPKNVAPSGFSMKMRKHLRNKRLEVLKQIAMDRVVDLQFGTDEAAYHIILELYDRGNIVLTDYQLTILNILRPHTEGEEVRFAVRERYPIERARNRAVPTIEELSNIISNSKRGEPVKKVLNPHLVYGAALIEHVLLKAEFPYNCKLGQNFQDADIPKLLEALHLAENIIDEAISQPSKGYIIQKKEIRPKPNGESEDFYTNNEFHPLVFQQFKSQPIKEFETFNAAVDEFFSTLESQKIDLKAIQQEKDALKKLENVKKDHSERLVQLEKTQELDKHRAELITRNQAIVDQAILIIRSALANQVSWPDINDLVKTAAAHGDPVASVIKQLKLDINHITLLLSDPYAESNPSESEEDSENCLKPILVDIDLDLGAFANAKRYYDLKRLAAKKQQKTIESQGKALKSAEKKTKQTLKEVQTITNISKARKIFWFEKFFWFISSENFLVIGGRDQQQNELIVKRYLRGTDIYVHADVHGASSIVILNPSGQPVPPKTLNEAGVMAVCYSAAWEAKVVTSAWWVHADQVSKTAPTGEYLTTGAFMIRGKKNYLPPCHLIMGFGFLFKLEESSILRHKDERRVREVDDDLKEAETEKDVEEEVELSDDENEDKKEENEQPKLECIEEQSKEVEEDEEQQKEEDEPHFPDTEIRIEHTPENKAYITSTMGALSLSRNNSESEQTSSITSNNTNNNNNNNKIHIRPDVNKKNNQKNKKQIKSEINDDNENEKHSKNQKLKRGQKGKLKKMKEKYKDQDEEERKLIMEILQSAGSGKESKKNKKGGSKDISSDKKLKQKGSMQPQKPRQTTHDQIIIPGGTAADYDESEPAFVANIDMLDSLTGCPVAEDELLFAVPIIAPYNTLQNYKYKIKMTPGNSKRGKAARAAVNVFLNDRTASSHEKDLLKSVKEQELFQNLPGKVKLLAPNLHQQKHRK
ncbi:nuclear export mediator factor NEMF homolog Clbn [Lycorma delicatula]|uniref:nuclear export mediator factor NEMF homolog Clbn n=1 Tax=Lycorma delicatula TaxID=130591 RepID=UPI003F513989